VAAQIGTTGAFENQKGRRVELKNYDEIGLALRIMVAGRISGVVADEPTQRIISRKEEYKAKFQIVGEPFTENLTGRRRKGIRIARSDQ